MWVATKIGFFSATRSTVDPDLIQVRARHERDLKNLRRFAREWKTPIGKIVRTPEADYPARIIMKPTTWADLLYYLGQDIDYTNFKSTITGSRHDTYLGVWADLIEIEQEPGGREASR